MLSHSLVLSPVQRLTANEQFPPSCTTTGCPLSSIKMNGWQYHSNPSGLPEKPFSLTTTSDPAEKLLARSTVSKVALGRSVPLGDPTKPNTIEASSPSPLMRAGSECENTTSRSFISGSLAGTATGTHGNPCAWPPSAVLLSTLCT
ncbi:hypothetical protein Pelo_19153 [Pelomyxa schiedti]|nr:hypothetical protein Pelo_19153 [Pelomyxa schiedti]